MTIDVSNNDPRIEYSVSQGSSQSVFSVPFEFFDNSDVKVYVDDVLKSEGAHYSLSGGDGSTGTLTFSSPVVGATGGSVVVLARHISLERVTDFVAGQDINRAALNEQLDTIVAQVADLDNKIDRTIHLSDSEVAPSMLLTSDRKGRVLAFNSTTGDVEAGPLSNDIAIIADNIAEILDVNDQSAAAAASEAAAANSATAAQTAQTAAELAETNAETAETNAAASAVTAASEATTATTKASEAATSASNAATSESNAASSATASAGSASAAATSETNAATSETNAATSEANAATSETNAATSATASAGSATAAAASETAAATSESNAAASEAAASTSETNAAASEASAATDAATATTKASEASTSATNAAASASSAQASKDAALAALDNFDDRYLGQKASDPATDNDGDPLVSGALYFNTTDEIMKVYDGSLWVAAYASLSGAMFGANNLSDVASASDSRSNLGLGTAATTASTDYATAAQGSLADSAVQPNDSPSFGSVTVTGTVDGRDVAADGSKLDGIESGATADQTAGEIKTAYESNADTNAFTDAEQSKLSGIESGATADQSASEILTAVKTVDGSGSGLDADLLDGQHGSYYYPASNPNGYTSSVGDITGVTAGSGISGGGTSGTVTISHADTSSQGSVNNSGSTFIQDITLDTYGHITSIGSATVSSGGMTLLGSVATTSGKSATLSGLNLTSYKCLLIVGKAISFTATNQYVALGPDNGTGFWPSNQSIAYLTSSDTYVVSFMTWVDIINNVFGSSGNMASVNPSNGGVASISNQAIANYGHGYTQASTSITLSSDGTFDAGNIYIYGVA